MSQAFIGIDNVNEFFTQHYLAAILDGDLKDVRKTWKETAEQAGTGRRRGRTPSQALEVTHQSFFRTRERLDALQRPTERVALHHQLCAELLTALGYTAKLGTTVLPEGHLPLLTEVPRPDGSPLLWAIAAPGRHDAEGSTLAQGLLPAQLDAVPAAATDERTLATGSVEELVTSAFSLEEPPRFILVLGPRDLVLLERGKWSEQRLLRFDWVEVLGRRERATLDVAAALLHRQHLAPGQDAPLLDQLDDNSHKHAFEVSEDLKYALQASIERLGNAVIHHKRTVSKQKLFGTDVAERLSSECLTYMYRLLFLFYIEARPELGYVPMGSDAYRLGYSLERLRELEQLDLQTEEARTGTYIHHCLQKLFALIHDGTPRGERDQALFAGEQGEKAEALRKESLAGTFRLEPLRSHLFDPERTSLLNGVPLSNEVLRDVIEWMSLTRPSGKGKKAKRRGRISYATLGINQLGAVYEALLSFRGFFAEEELYEVKPKKQKQADVLQTAYFVPAAEIMQYHKDERVYEDDGTTLKRYPVGTFLYRLAGRDRQTSASYYTPEVLTRCVVKYALKELLEDEAGSPVKTADEILELTVCEPAMGSAAFLNEAVDQLAEAYLTAKQRELGQRIPHDEYGFEKQRVKMYLADNNVFGVDLNPVAVELAEVSLWLNTIHAGGFVPWFGGQTACGNSLVGARRQVYAKKQVHAGKQGDRTTWLSKPPTAVPLSAARPKGSVYHFLLGDPGMCAYGHGNEGKPIRAMMGEALEHIDAWRQDFCAPVAGDDLTALGELSDAIDALWMRHVTLLRRIRERTTDPLAVYGRPLPKGARGPTTTAEKDAIWAAELQSKEVRAASPYRRLKLAMDYWCALWFWPMEEAEELPNRDEFLTDLALFLDMDVLTTLQGGPQRDLFGPTMPADEARRLADELGVVNVDALIQRNRRLQIVTELAERYRFLHWELEFADQFYHRGGFDLMLGNPPWVRVQWKEQDILGDMDPSFVLRKLSAAQTAQRREEALQPAGRLSRYLGAHENAAGTQAFLTAKQNYPELQGIKANLYKCFLPLVWAWTSQQGVSSLLHPEGVYDDPKGGRLREALYPRLRRHYQFHNELDLFVEVHHQTKFSINITASPGRRPGFLHLANLFAPATVDACHAHLGKGPVPGIKEDGQWAVQGHRDRIVEVDQRTLALFAAVYDQEGTPALRARLPALHSRQLVEVLAAFRDAPRRLSHIEGFFPSFCFNETYAQHDGTIARAEPAVFPERPEQLILSGPHFFVGNPHYKTPRAVCTNNSHYDVLDLTTLPADYLPRTNYLPACTPADYRSRTPKVPWLKEHDAPITSFYRVIIPNMVAPAGERTLQPAVCVRPSGHVHTVNSYAFRQSADLLRVQSSWCSLPVDFFVKSTGSGHFQPSMARQVPLPTRHEPQLFARTLLLNCLTTHYAELWRAGFDPAFTSDAWTKDDPRLPATAFTELGPEWTWQTPLRTDYARRQALVELDVLVAMGLGLTLEQLQTLYRAQFYVMRGYEEDTWYDQNGRIVFTNSKGLTGVGLKRTLPRKDPAPCWRDVQGMTSGTVEHTIVDDTLPGGPVERTIVYEAPFDRCDREADYATAWAAFTERFGEDR